MVNYILREDTRLLAKKPRDNSDYQYKRATLIDHLSQVRDACDKIVEVCGGKILYNMGLEDDNWLFRLKGVMKIVGWMHDIGKANSHFDRMIKDKSKEKQSIRHEVVGMYLMDNSEIIKNWLEESLKVFDEKDREIIRNVIYQAIVGHHVKFDKEYKKSIPGRTDVDLDKLIIVMTSHENFKEIFGNASEEDLEIDVRTIEFKKWISGIEIRDRDWKKFLNNKDNNDWKKFAAVCGCLLMAGDAVASASAEIDFDIQEFIEHELSLLLTKKNITQLIREKLGDARKSKWWQNNACKSSERIHVFLGGTGIGKTILIYRWAWAHAKNGKLFVCYPTTHTAREGFGDYVMKSGVEGELISSRAAIDLEDLINEALQGGGWKKEQDDDKVKIESLKMWGARIINCTADTVLSLVRNRPKGMYASPAILSGAFAFDEIHAYDEKMFDALIEFMKIMKNSHFLLTSASISAERLKRIQEVFGDEAKITYSENIKSISKYEKYPRYEIEFVGYDYDVKEMIMRNNIEAKILDGYKFLWIRNRVAWCQEGYFVVNMQDKTIVYHSRFKYEDRKEQHKCTMMTLGKSGTGGITIASQVAEMSLNIDSDMGIIDLCDIFGLIQRLGRFCRYIDEKPEPKKIIIMDINEGDELPYSKQQLNLAREWIAKLLKKGNPLTQRDLYEAYSEIENNLERQYNKKEFLELFDTGFYSVRGDVREPSYVVCVVMEEDREYWEKDFKQLELKSFPLPFNKMMTDWERHKGRLVAPLGSVYYSKITGAELIK